jgi:hypothetical protein
VTAPQPEAETPEAVEPEPEVEPELASETVEVEVEVEVEVDEPEAPKPAKKAAKKTAAAKAAHPLDPKLPAGMAPWYVVTVGVMREEDENGPVWWVCEGEKDFEEHATEDEAKAAYDAKVVPLLKKDQRKRFKYDTAVMWCRTLATGMSVREICAGGFDEDAWAIEAEADFRHVDFTNELFGLKKAGQRRRAKKAVKKDADRGEIVPRAKRKTS